MLTFLIVIAIVLSIAANLGNALAATLANTRIANFEAADSGGVATIMGVLQYRRNATSDWLPINGSKVTLSWWTPSSSLKTYIEDVYTDDQHSSQPGSFTFSWEHHLEPGDYYVEGKYAGAESWTVGGVSYTSSNCTENTQLLIRLKLAISVDKPTASVAQGDSVTAAISVDTVNTNDPHPVSLSMIHPDRLFLNYTFTRVSGNTPLRSNLRLDVFNVTEPGTYTVTIFASSDEDSSVKQPTTLILYVQQNTHVITVEIQGLPSDIETSLYVDRSVIQSMGTGTTTLTISNKTKSVSVLPEIISGDTLYLCEDYTGATDAAGIDSFVFKYVTEYRLKISGDLPQSLVCKLVLKADDADKSISEFNPTQGYNDFLPKDANVTFAISPLYITTTQVNYKFREWKERMTGQIISVSNSTADGLFVVRLSRPLDLRAYYDKWITVTIRTNLPSESSTNLQIGLVGSEKKDVAVTGSVAYNAGEFPAGAAFECTIPVDQLVLYNTIGSIRYEFQGLSPSSPITLVQHTTLNINYTTKYKVQVTSKFPDAVVQPPGGVGWYVPSQIATLQVVGEAKDNYGIPYLFDGWAGAISSNETVVGFPVMAPVDIEVRWKVNWYYLLTLGGAFVGVAVPSAIVVKKKVLVRKVWRKKKPPSKKRDDSEGGLSDNDLRVYNYIMTKGGSLRISEAETDLEMGRDAIKESIAALRERQLLR
jgi:hypothetical protein